jgi:hypothetical protein
MLWSRNYWTDRQIKKRHCMRKGNRPNTRGRGIDRVRKEELALKGGPADPEALTTGELQTRFVIIDGPRSPTAGDTHYISITGTWTARRSEAARFYFFQDAKDFALRHKIALTQSTYIGREHFTEFELQG